MSDTSEKNTWALALRFLRKRKRTGKADIAKLHQSLDQGLDLHADAVSMTPSLEKEEAASSLQKHTLYQRTTSGSSSNCFNNKVNTKADRKPVLILKMINSPTDSLLSPCSQMLWHKLQSSPKRYNNKGIRSQVNGGIGNDNSNCQSGQEKENKHHQRPSTPTGSGSSIKFITDEEKENIALTPVSRTKRTTLI